ncbi:hypothetical protein KY348_05980 [Candidatus Woesearchaeota archaeon]|nr:hypothetical protein [Candidatus Woesearchaeota archaeon]
MTDKSSSKENWIEKFATIHDHISSANNMYNELLRKTQKIKAVYLATVLSSIPDTPAKKGYIYVASQDETYVLEEDLEDIIDENKDNPVLLKNMPSIKKLQKILSETSDTIAVIKEKAETGLSYIESYKANADPLYVSIFKWYLNDLKETCQILLEIE